MKKTLLTAAVIAVTIAAASCQKDSSKENLTSAPQFTATIEDGSSTKTTVEKVAGTPATYKTNWESTDKISVNGAVYTATPKTDATKAEFNYTSGTAPKAPYSAYYPATVYDGTTATLPASYTYAEGKYNMPMYAYNATTTSLSFKNLCGVLAITVPSTQITSVSSITVISDQQMNGAFTATSEGVLSFASKTLTADDKKVTLTFSEPMSIEGGSSETFYIPVPAGTHDPLTINVSNGSIMRTMVTRKSGGVEVARNTVYPISFADNHSDLFSVSAGKKVHFTKGNLYWNDPDWHLESNQYDCPSEYQTSHVGHFFWSKEASVAYAQLYSDDSHASTDYFFCGEGHELTVDGQGGLYALSSSEWNYLISTRASNLHKKGVTVNNKSKCLIIAPDGYTGEIAATYSAEQWTAAESQGLVCLPAAGYRSDSGVSDVCSYGGYWSSTPCGEGDDDYAYYLNFGSNVTDDYRYFGYSVRLVYSAQ